MSDIADTLVAMDAGHTHYTPSGGLLELKKAICRAYQRDYDLDYQPAQVIVSNGAKAHTDFELEQLVRLTVLEVLYTDRRTTPGSPGIFDLDLESLIDYGASPRATLAMTTAARSSTGRRSLAGSPWSSATACSTAPILRSYWPSSKLPYHSPSYSPAGEPI